MFSGRCYFDISCVMIFILYFILFYFNFIYGSKDGNWSMSREFRWFGHRSSSTLMKAKYVASKAKNHHILIFFSSIFVAEVLFYCNYYEWYQRKKKWIKKYLYIYDMVYNADRNMWIEMDHPFDLGTSQQEVNCMNVNEFGHWLRVWYIKRNTNQLYQLWRKARFFVVYVRSR